MIIAVLAFCQIAWHACATVQWIRYSAAFRDSLGSHKGIISIEQAQMDPEALMKRGIVDMGRDWTYPILSLLLAPGGKVYSMIEPLPPGVRRRFIFNAHSRAERPNLSAYGIVYEIEDDK